LDKQFTGLKLEVGCLNRFMEHENLTHAQGKCNTKNIESGSGVDQKFDFLNRCSDDRSETVDAKISSKRDHFTIHMLDSEVGWITDR
jgi:hypothetical protein